MAVRTRFHSSNFTRHELTGLREPMFSASEPISEDNTRIAVDVINTIDHSSSTVIMVTPEILQIVENDDSGKYLFPHPL